MNQQKNQSKKPKKHPDADKISKKLCQEAEELRQKREEEARLELQKAIEEREERISKAKKVLAGGVIEAAKFIVDSLKLPDRLDEDEGRAAQLKAKNAQYTLKIHGLETEIAKQDGLNININISSDHAAKVERAAHLTGGL